MPPWVRASSLDRVLRCPASLVLEQEEEENDADRIKEARAWGTMVHGWKATGNLQAPQHRQLPSLFVPFDRERWWPEGGDHEITWARNTVTGGHFTFRNKSEKKRNEWKLAHDEEWETGSTDYAGWLMGDPWIDDLKTGFKPPESVDGFYPLHWYAEQWAHELGWKGDVVISITHKPRYPKARPPTRYWGRLSGDYIKAFRQRMKDLRETVMRLKQKKLAVVDAVAPSERACEWCRGKPVCPVWND